MCNLAGHRLELQSQTGDKKLLLSLKWVQIWHWCLLLQLATPISITGPPRTETNYPLENVQGLPLLFPIQPYSAIASWNISSPGDDLHTTSSAACWLINIMKHKGKVMLLINQDGNIKTSSWKVLPGHWVQFPAFVGNYVLEESLLLSIQMVQTQKYQDEPRIGHWLE